MGARSTRRCLSTLGLACLGGGVSAACASSADRVAVSITTVQDTVSLVRNPDAAFFRISALMRNTKGNALVISGCAPSAQREIDSQWVTVFLPFCFGSDQLILMPGDSVVIPVFIYGYTAANTGPHLDPRMIAGRYRLLFGVSPWNQSGTVTGPARSEQVASSPFFVKEGP